MKKIRFNRKLILDKVTIALLDNDELQRVKGGKHPTEDAQTRSFTCKCTWTCPYTTEVPPSYL